MPVLALLLAIQSTPIQTRHDLSLKAGTTETGGEVITAQAINTTKYTGWIYVDSVKQLVLAVDYTNSTGTDVQMTCKSALTSAGANGTGFDIMAVSSDGTTTLFTWSNAVTGDEDWTWTVFEIPMPWINCAFISTAAGAGDLATVTVLGVSP